MANKWYGSLQNRLEENNMFCEEITVGMGMTEYLYSDRHPYEVIGVFDQKHVVVRLLDHKPKGECYSNEWELISNEKNPTYVLTKRGKYWYNTITVTSDILDELKEAKDADDTEKQIRIALFLAHNDIDCDKLRDMGKITRYHRMNVSFGTAEYYYDYSF